MFLVRENLETRKKQIRKAYKANPIQGLYLAQRNLEWVIKRALLIMDRTSGKELYRKGLGKYESFGQFARIWEQQTNGSADNKISKSSLSLDKVIDQWESIKKIGLTLHPVARKSNGELMPAYTEDKLEAMINAAAEVHKYAMQIGVDVFKRLPVYRKNARRSRR